jgi:predicted Zn finger-like uncharacterized protein
MYTQCPGCRTIFEIDEDALQASLGIVRCGQCSERFDALRTLSSTLPLEPDAALPVHDPEEHAPTLTASVSPEALFAISEARQAADVEADTPDAGQAPDARAGDEWLNTLSGQRAQALIADAAGIPHDAIQGDPAWEIVELPVQTGFMDLDTIAIEPMSRAEEPDRDMAAPDATPADEPLQSDPPDESWAIDIPDAGNTDPTVSIEESRDEPEAFAADSTPPPADETETAATHVFGEKVHTEDEPVDTQSNESGDAIDDDDVQEPDRVEFEQDSIIESDQEAWTDDTDDTTEIETNENAPAAPVYVRPQRRRIRRGDWLWALGSVMLTLALAMQLAWAKRVALIRDPATQAWAMRVCASLGCRLPPIRDIAKLELLSRDIRPDPDTSGALTITATLRNDAHFRQPWPIVMVQLTDLDNNVVAMRRFRPAEYMPDPARRTAGIAPGTTAAVAFEVADPGKRAVSFHFGFE